MILDLGPLKLHYEVSGSGKPLILLHGNGEDMTIFDKALPLLEKHFTVYRLDTRCHGGSTKMPKIHYTLIADDLHVFIKLLKIEKPVVYGFSDGGIASLLLEIRHPGTASALIVSGANTKPRGLKLWYRVGAWNAFQRTRDPLINLMLSEPHIKKEELESINIPVLITAGEKDLVRRRNTEFIRNSIPDSKLMILSGEHHQSYVVDSDKIAKIIIEAEHERNGI